LRGADNAPQTNREDRELSKKSINNLAEPGDTEMFISDRKGDPLNLSYRSLSRSSVPRYRRSGFGSVLGAPARMKIDRFESNERKIVLRVSEHSETSLSPLSAKLGQSSRRHRLIAPESTDNQLAENSNYISLRREKNRASLTTEPPSNDIDEGFLEKIKDKSEAPSDSDLELSSDSDLLHDYDHPDDVAARNRNAELTRLCKTEPRNMENWIQLLKHQDVMIKLGCSSQFADPTDTVRQNLAHIKVSIYKDALRKADGQSEAMDTLWMGQLREGTKIWDAKALAQKWDEAVQARPNSIKLRIDRLNYMQSNGSVFRFGELVLSAL